MTTRVLPLLLVFGALLACRGGAEAKRVRAPDGRVGYSLSCRSPGHCHEKAGQLCPRGYDVFDSTQTVERNPLGGMSKQTTDDYAVRDTALIACR